MALVGKSTLFKHGIARTVYCAIPADVAVDSKFPFKVGEKVIVEVKGDKLEVRKA